MNKTVAQACRLRDVAADRRFTHSVGEEAPTSLRLKLAAAPVLILGENFPRRADDAVALVVVSDGVGNGQLHARALLDLLVNCPRDVTGRFLEKEDTLPGCARISRRPSPPNFLSRDSTVWV